MSQPLSYEELQDRIHEIEKSVQDLIALRNAAKAEEQSSIDTVRHIRAEYERVIAEEVARLTRERDEKAHEAWTNREKYGEAIVAANQEIQTCRLELNRLQVDLARELEKRQMARKLDEAEKVLTELAQDTIWFKKAMPFQHEDIAFTVSAYLSGLNGVLNANDMSLGKTMETAATHFVLSYLFEQEHKRKPRCLWLTKKSLTDSNVREIRKWLGDTFTPVVVKGGPDQRRFAVELGLEADQLIVANHEAVRTTKLLQEIQWDLVYIDEVHKLKGGANATPTEVWRAIKDVCVKARFVCMLSGTPMVNAVEDMWSYLHIFAPERFDTVKNFKREFTLYNGTVDFERILKSLKSQCFRRRKDEVKDQLHKALGDKVRMFRYLERTPLQDEKYQLAKQFVLSGFDKMDPGASVGITAIIAQLTRLRQINLWPAGVVLKNPETDAEMVLDCHEGIKIDEAMDLIEQLTDSGEQVVVFSAQFNEPLYEIQRRVRERGLTCEALTGKTVMHVGQFEESFQQGKIDVLCINSATGSEGLNLHKNAEEWPGGSSNAIFLDLWYSPVRNVQGEDRLWRFGSEETINIHILQCENSVDKLIASILEEKQQKIDGVMESDQLRTPGEWKKFLGEML